MNQDPARFRAAMRRLASDERWWAAEIVVRGTGALLLASCAGAVASLHRAVGSPRDTCIAECALAAFAVLCWWLGWAFAIEGPGLFRHIPVPGRHGML